MHISELADFRVNRTEDVVKIGDMIWVKCIGIDDKGRVKLSRKAALKERAEKKQAKLCNSQILLAERDVPKRSSVIARRRFSTLCMRKPRCAEDSALYSTVRPS